MATWLVLLLVWTVGIPVAVVALAWARTQIACWRQARRAKAARDALRSPIPVLRPHSQAPVTPRAMAGYRK